MNRTSNYNLCQFEENDQVQRTDFNEDNVKLDAALAGVVRRVAELEKDRFYFGSYVGNGVCPRTISLPWTPKIMLLLSWSYNSDCVIMLTHNSTTLIRGDSVSHSLVGYINLQGSTLTLLHEYINRSGKSSSYILFR